MHEDWSIMMQVLRELTGLRGCMMLAKVIRCQCLLAMVIR